MNPDLLRDIEALRKQGASEADIEAYVVQHGGKLVEPKKESWLGTQARATAAGVGGMALNTLGRTASFIDAALPGTALDSGMGDSFRGAASSFRERVAPKNPQRRAEFESGAAGAEMAGELAKYAATGGAASLARGGSKLAGVLAPMALGAVEDAGTKPGESVADLLAQGSDYLEKKFPADQTVAGLITGERPQGGFGRAADYLRTQGQSAGGRASIGALLGLVPEAAIKSAAAGVRGIKGALDGSPVAAVDELFRMPERSPETNPSKLLPAQTTDFKDYGTQGPAIPMRGEVARPDVSPEDANEVLRLASQRAQVAENAAARDAGMGVPQRPTRRPRLQKELMQELRESLERRQAQADADARSNRALPVEDVDASASLAAASAQAPREPNRTLSGLFTRPGQTSPEVLGTLAGGGTGALVGGTQGDTPEERALNAALGGAAGAAGGRMALRGATGAGAGMKARKGAVDLNPLMSALRNVNKQSLKRIINLGGEPMPSVAVVPEAQPFTEFGDISLVGRNHQVDPELTEHIWNVDVYSPRVPDPEVGLKMPDDALIPHMSAPYRTALAAAVYEQDPQAAEKILVKHFADAGPVPYEKLEFEAKLQQYSSALTQASRFLRKHMLQQGVRVGDELKPYTLDNMLANMKSVGPDIRGKESAHWSQEGAPVHLGYLQASLAKPWRDLEEMRASTAKGIKEPRRVQKYRDATQEALADWTISGGAQLGKFVVNPDDIERGWAEYVKLATELEETTGKPASISVLRNVLKLYHALPNFGDAKLEAEWLEKGRALSRRFLRSPTDYYEAKPERVVPFTSDEWAGVHLPGSVASDAHIMDALKRADVPYQFYLNEPAAFDYNIDKLNEHRHESLTRFRRELQEQGRQPLGFVAPELLGTAGGAAIGGAVGAAVDDEDPFRGGALGAALGGLGGRTAMRMGGGSPPPPRRPVSPMPQGTPYTSSNLLHPSNQALDPDGYRLWQLEQKKLVDAGETKRRVSDADIDAWARSVDVDELSRSDASKLTTVELKALGIRIEQDRETFGKMIDEYATATPARKAQLDTDMDLALGRLTSYDRVLNRASSEQGRGLRILSKLAAKQGTMAGAIAAAQKALGTKVLNPQIEQQLLGVMKNPAYTTANQRAAALKQVIQQHTKQSPMQVMLDVRRWGMLTAPVTWAVNIVGTAAEAANKMVVTPVAAALDQAYVAANKVGGRSVDRSVTMRGRNKGWVEGFGKGVKSIDRDLLLRGIDPEDPLNNLHTQRVNYANSLGLDAASGNEAWRTASRKVADVLQTSGDAIYGLMSASDRPFFQAALSASLAERGALRAMREGLDPGTPAFQQRVADLSDLLTADPLDAMMAKVEALDDTFKTPTKVARAVKELGPGAQYAVPYANTPTNLIRKAMEAIPGVGTAVNQAQVARLRKKLTEAGMDAVDINREVRRVRTNGLAKQLSTGVGVITAGFTLAQAGVLTGDYVDPMGREASERDEANRQKLTGQGPLTIRVGDKAHSVAAFAQFAPLLAMGHALYQEHKRQEEAGDGFSIGNFAGRSLASTARTAVEMPLLQGAKNAMELAESKGSDLGKFLGREAASMVPYSSALAATARATDPIAKRDPETFAESMQERLPGLRDNVAPKVGPLGEVTERVGVLESVLSPTRPTRVRGGDLYAALEGHKFYPSSPPKREGETSHQYAARRRQEGESERALLEALVKGDPRAWDFVSPQAKRQFRKDRDYRALLAAALRKQRGAVTRQHTDQLTLAGGTP